MSRWLRREGETFQVTLFGNHFALLRSPNADTLNLPQIGKRILEQKFDFIDEVIGTEVEICLKFNQNYRSESLNELESLAPSDPSAKVSQPFTTWRLPVWFPENETSWSTIYEHTGLDRESYLSQLLKSPLQVSMIGFLPGFLYLSGLPEHLLVPRRAVPTKRTVQNGFAIGGAYAGIYSLPSPAGWNIIGQVGVQLLKTDRLPPLLVQPGDKLSLERVDQLTYQQLATSSTTIRQYNG